MNYSTFNINNFFIKKNSTFPLFKYPLIQQIREKYDITDDMLENVAVTFSMMDADTGLYKIANAPANLVIINDIAANPDEEKYTLTYKFKLKDTNRSGRYLAEITVDFLGSQYGCGKIKFPIEGYVNVVISDSITKTTVI